MELNGRTWGSLALAERRGLHYPAWAVELAHDASFRPTTALPGAPVTVRHLGRELAHLAFVARGRHRVRAAQRQGVPPAPELVAYPTLPRALRDVTVWRRDQRLYNYRRGQARVLLSDTVNVLSGLAPRAGGLR
jgi:hypothetical protein